MATFLIRRLMATLPTLFGVALLVFVLFHMVGGDPCYTLLGKYVTVEKLADCHRETGMDRALPLQFLMFLKQIVTFDFGFSLATHRSISKMITDGMGPSLMLLGPTFFITILVSVILSLWVAYKRGGWIDKIVVIICVMGMSAPMLALILFGQYFFAYRMGMFPITGFDSGWPSGIRYIILPGIIYFMVSLGGEVRFYRTAILEEVAQDYVRTARAKGLTDSVIFLKHILRNSLVPIITSVVLEIPLLVLGSFLLEDFFSIPGLGSITIDALKSSDFPVIQAMTIFNAYLLIFGNLMTDILYKVVDPRMAIK